LAAGEVYPGVKELGGNGSAHLVFAGGDGREMSCDADVVVSKGVLVHDAIGSRVEDIAAEISFKEDLVEIKGMTASLGASRVEAAGWLRPGKKVEIDLTLKSKDLALASLGKVVFAGEPADLSGSGAVELRLRGFYPNLEYSGQITLKGASVSHPALGSALAGIQGVIVLAGKEMATNSLKMTFAGSPLEVRGQIIDPLNPRFDLTVSLADIDIGQITRIISPGAGNSFAGKGRITARLTGTLEEVYADGSADLSTLSVRAGGKTLAASRVQGKFRYGNDALTLRETSASVAGGRVTLNGVVALGKKRTGDPGARLIASVKGISAKEIASYFLPPELAISGTFDGDAAVTGGPGSYSIAGSCVVSSGSLAGYSFSRLEADFRAADGKVTLDRLASEGAEGGLDAKGVVFTDGGFNLQVVAKGFDLGELAKLAGYTGASGVATFAGTVSGKGRDVVIDGLADITKPMAEGRRFDALTGRVRLSARELFLDSVTLRAGNASYLVSGTVGLERDRQQLSLVVRLSKAPCAELMSLAKIDDVPLSGLVSGEIALKGSVKDPEARGSVELISGEVAGVKLDKASVDFGFTANVLGITRLSVKVGPARITASGTLTKGGSLDLSVNASDLDLANLPVDIPHNPVSAGIASFHGKVTGDMKAPCLEGQITAKNVVLMNALFPGAAGTLRWKGGGLEFAPLVIHDGTGTATVTGAVLAGKKDTALDLALEVAGLRLTTVLHLVRPGQDLPMEGTASGRVIARGSASSPNVEASLEASNMRIGGVAFAGGTVEAGIAGGELNLKVLRVRQASGGYLEASGTSKSGGAISFAASARRFDASVLATLFGVRYAVKGVMDCAAKVEGTSTDPTATLSMKLTDGSIEKLYFDALAARMVFRDGVITLEEGEIIQGQHRASVTGKVPLAPQQLAALGVPVPKGQGALDLVIRMENTSLVLLMLLSDQIEWAEGAANVDLRVSGRIDAPELHGYAQVREGRIKLAPLADVLGDMTAKISFDGTQADVESLSCRLGDGSINASGRIAFAPGGSRLDLRVTSTRARVQARGFRALVDSDIAVYGPARRPLLSGQLKLAKAEFTPGGWDFEGDLPFDADLALSVSTEGDLRVRTNIMDIPAWGTLEIGGTLKQPDVTGTVEARRGWFAYFGNEFVVRRAVAEFRGDNGIMPSVDVEAETRAGSTTIYLALRGTPPDGLSLDLSSSPPKSRDEILALLNYPGALAKILEGDVEGAFKEEIARIFDQELRLQFVGGIERTFEDVLSLDEFRLQRSTSNELTLRIGKYVVDDLYLTYEKGFGPESFGVLKFDYFYRPGIVLSGRYDERGIYTFGLEARLRF
ncbi:MAG: translocation/assembly module TamB domain-containing protein, partial [Bacillota bacterium]